eukprot:Phypoly_transcript_18655.p1 GENE.Phypoly_transcript_18655~~Phypoly_transcript_18655.p1  ORF type:complete len:116 (-),score=28.72 Phypoly_transcript_18655:37-384(-)
MSGLHDRIAKMKRRAASLYQKKEQVEKLQAERREKDAQRERDLNAKPSQSLLVPSKSASSIPEAGIASPAAPHHPPTRHASVPVILPPSVSSAPSAPSSATPSPPHSHTRRPAIH